jgi:deoxyribonuclease-4
MNDLLFGTGGVPNSSSDRSTAAGIERVLELGLGCMELEWVQGVKITERTAIETGKLAGEKGIVLSAHAPYALNLNSREPEKIAASKQRILQTARLAYLCGARSIIFHAAFYLGDPAEIVYERIKRHISEIMETLKKEDNHIWIRPELMGKPSQFGSLSELIKLSQEIEGVFPCIDFAHYHARTNKFNSYAEFASILDSLDRELGRYALNNMHIHISGIKYTKAGEIKHLNLEDSDFNYTDFVKALCDYKVQGLVVCESPNLEEDAALLQRIYHSISSPQATPKPDKARGS